MAVPSSEPDERVGPNGLSYGMRGCADDTAGEYEDIAEKDEVAAAEQIAIGSTDHEGDCAARCVD